MIKINRLRNYLSFCMACAFMFSPLSGVASVQGVPGGVLKVPLGSEYKNAPKVMFNDKKTLTYYDNGQWHALVGIPLTQKTGSGTLNILPAWGPHKEVSFNINEKHYPQERIQIKDKTKVTPPASDMSRIIKESQSLKRIYANWDNKKIHDIYLTHPVKGRISSQFGFKRVINNIPKSPHKGIDIAAKIGTPIKAANLGKVTLIGDLFYTGNTVVVDHGQGWQTIYCHLNEILVKKGQQVDTSTILGTVGKTGRATGPHLHFGVVLNEVKVDPSLFWKDTN